MNSCYKNLSLSNWTDSDRMRAACMAYIYFSGVIKLSKMLTDVEVVYVCNFMCYVQRVELTLCFVLGVLRFRKDIYLLFLCVFF